MAERTIKCHRCDFHASSTKGMNIHLRRKHRVDRFHPFSFPRSCGFSSVFDCHPDECSGFQKHVVVPPRQNNLLARRQLSHIHNLCFAQSGSGHVPPKQGAADGAHGTEMSYQPRSCRSANASASFHKQACHPSSPNSTGTQSPSGSVLGSPNYYAAKSPQSNPFDVFDSVHIHSRVPGFSPSSRESGDAARNR